MRKWLPVLMLVLSSAAHEYTHHPNEEMVDLVEFASKKR